MMLATPLITVSSCPSIASSVLAAPAAAQAATVGSNLLITHAGRISVQADSFHASLQLYQQFQLRLTSELWLMSVLNCVGRVSVEEEV